MKRVIGLFVLTLFPLFAYAQEIQQKNVPAVVLNAFQLKFSNATDVKWKLQKGTYYVGFEVNNKENELVMSDRGNILKHQQELYASEIPQVVLETIKSKVVFFDLNDANRLQEGNKIVYKVNFEIDEKDHDFWIDEKGKLLKYTKELKNSELPVSISTLIKSKYGSLDIDDATVTEESGKIIYSLKGKINEMDHAFILTDKATVLEHEQELKNSEIPVHVLSAAKAAYNGYEIRNAGLTDEGGNVIYHLEMRKSKGKVFAVFNSEGKMIEVKK